MSAKLTEAFVAWRDNVKDWIASENARYEELKESGDVSSYTIDAAAQAKAEARNYATRWADIQDDLDLRKARVLSNHGNLENASFSEAELEHASGWREELAEYASTLDGSWKGTGELIKALATTKDLRQVDITAEQARALSGVERFDQISQLNSTLHNFIDSKINGNALAA